MLEFNSTKVAVYGLLPFLFPIILTVGVVSEFSSASIRSIGFPDPLICKLADGCNATPIPTLSPSIDITR